MKFKRVQNYWNRQALVKYFFLVIMVVFVYQAISIHSHEINGASLKNKASTNAEKTLTENAVRGLQSRKTNTYPLRLMQVVSMLSDSRCVFRLSTQH